MQLLFLKRNNNCSKNSGTLFEICHRKKVLLIEKYLFRRFHHIATNFGVSIRAPTWGAISVHINHLTRRIISIRAPLAMLFVISIRAPARRAIAKMNNNFKYLQQKRTNQTNSMLTNRPIHPLKKRKKLSYTPESSANLIVFFCSLGLRAGHLNKTYSHDSTYRLQRFLITLRK